MLFLFSDLITLLLRWRYVWTVFTIITSMEWPNQWWAYPEPDFLMKKCQFGSGFWGYTAINTTGICYAETLLLEYSLTRMLFWLVDEIQRAAGTHLALSLEFLIPNMHQVSRIFWITVFWFTTRLNLDESEIHLCNLCKFKIQF